MVTPTPGVHHVTAVASDPAENLRFYTETLGLRLVKRSVNQDDTGVYHLFYGDHEGTTGTSMTFFPYVDARPGEVGAGQATATAFLVPAASLDYWRDRLAEAGVDVDERERFDESVLAFADPDGLPLELVGRESVPESNLPESPVPAEHAIRGFDGVTLTVGDGETTADLLGRMGYEETGRADGRRRFESSGPRGSVVDLVVDDRAGSPGAGTVHHVAFTVADEEQEAWRDLLVDAGLRPTEVIDRKWFRSVYARTQEGVLFEFATPEPGYAVDEPVESLGESLVLPEWLEARRAEIEADLPPLPTPDAAR
jgi:glyoxalase family protein